MKIALKIRVAKQFTCRLQGVGVRVRAGERRCDAPGVEGVQHGQAAVVRL